MRKRKLLIVATVLTFAVLAVGLYMLRNNGQPQNLALEVTGQPGQKFVGFVMVDGVKQNLSGTLPFTMKYRASRTEFAFVPIEGRGDSPFAVSVEANGQPWAYCTGPLGIQGFLERTGVAGWGVNAGGIGGMNPSEVALLTR